MKISAFCKILHYTIYRLFDASDVFAHVPGVLLLESVSAAAVKLFALTLIVVEVGAETKSTLNPIVIFDLTDIIDVITSNIRKKVRFC
jgi:hypothetical protein